MRSCYNLDGKLGKPPVTCQTCQDFPLLNIHTIRYNAYNLYAGNRR